jgi:alkanesulfonate monooxygenase SsuD/methylene tetrahydromethanopterin reductase-like flavin-dependent oxidoreductase (luciferase family)
MAKKSVKVKVNFRKKAVKKAVDDANFSSLSKAGAFVRTTARRSIRPRHRKKKKETLQISEAQRQAFLKKLEEKDEAVLDAINKKRESERLARRSSIIGTPPLTGERKLLRKAIRYDIDRKNKDNIVIGTSSTVFDKIGRAHEHGGLFEGRKYPKRPFMNPALEKAKPRISRLWSNSVRG